MFIFVDFSCEASSLVAEYGDDSDEEQVSEQKFVDWNKMTCLLCKRQFPNKEILTKHTQMSDLHKVRVYLRCFLVPLPSTSQILNFSIIYITLKKVCLTDRNIGYLYLYLLHIWFVVCCGSIIPSRAYVEKSIETSSIN